MCTRDNSHIRERLLILEGKGPRAFARRREYKKKKSEVAPVRKWEENAGFRAKFARVEGRGGREEAWDEVRGCAFASSELDKYTMCPRARVCTRTSSRHYRGA